MTDRIASPPTHEQVEAWLREDTMAAASITPLLPICPSWCTDQHDAVRPLDIGRNDDGLVQATRFHRKPVVSVPHTEPDVGVRGDDIVIEIEQLEHVDINGVVTRHHAAVVLANADGVDISGDTLTRLCAALMVATDELADVIAIDAPANSACSVAWCANDHDERFHSVTIGDPDVAVEIHSVPVGDTAAVCQQEHRRSDGQSVMQPLYVESYLDVDMTTDPDGIVRHGIAIARAGVKLRELSS